MLHDTGGGGGGGEGWKERERRRERGRIYMVAEHSRVLNAMRDAIMHVHVYMMATKYNLATSSGAVATSLEEVTGETKIAM